MSLSAGATLGPYEIVSLLGRGGMGEVYRARDARLRRDVAIKILPASFAASPERRQRFEREAQMLASLNHPNIGAIYGLEEATGVCGLVLELVEGPTLAELLHRASGPGAEGPGLPLDDVLTIARQICDALDVAHEHGIVHRDLKPLNIKLTPDGAVKLLDFGLAKTTLDGVPDLTHSPTMVAGTIEGTLLGTVSYMSPEQARGRALDKRTDIWSFGCVLYELLTRRQAFPGDTISDTIAATLGRDPDWSALPAATPSSVRMLLELCLQKDPKQRLRDIGDARNYLRHRPESDTTHAATSARDRSRGATWVAAAAVGAAILLAIALARSRAPSAEPSLPNPLANGTFTRLTDFDGAEYDAAISPDGKWVVFVSDRDGPFDVWLGQIGTRRFVNLTHGTEPNLRTASVRVPGFSGDGSQVWFHSADPATSVRIMPLMGGESRIFLGKQSQNVAWSPDGTHIVYHTSDAGDPMFVADPSGANARQVLVGPPGTHNHHPAWSVDGAWIYFVSGSPTANRMDLWRVRASGGEPERLTQHNSSVGYPAAIDRQTILYVARDANRAGPWLWAFDAERKLTRRVSVGLEKFTSVSATADGRHLVATVANPSASLSSVPILGRVADERDVRAFQSPARALAPRFGGSALFYLSSGGTGDGLWRSQDGQILEIWKGADGAVLEPPAISKDGRRVAFVIKRNDKLRLQVEDSDGTDPRMIGETIDVQGTGDWSPDGKWIVTGGSDGQGDALFKIPVDGGAPVRLAAGSAINPVWSPRGNLIAYAGSQVGLFAPLLGVSPEGAPITLPDIKLHRDGERVRFLPNGDGLVYMQGPSAIQDFWLLDLTTKKSRQLTRLNNLAAMRTFDVTPDGMQIVFDRLRENSDIVLIELWHR